MGVDVVKSRETGSPDRYLLLAREVIAKWLVINSELTAEKLQKSQRRGDSYL